jgi:hypothetical protein
MMVELTVEVIDIVNHGEQHGDEQVVKYYYPVKLLMTGKLPGYKKKALFVIREEGEQRDIHRDGIFYPTTKRKLYDAVGKFVIEVEPAPCLSQRDFSSWVPEHLYAGFGDWHGTGLGPHNRPDVNFSVRLLVDQAFDPSLNKTQCAGKFKKDKGGIYRWKNDCNRPALQSQYFHISGQIQRCLAVCDAHISKGKGFGQILPSK